MSKSATVSQVVALMNHKRAETVWVARPVLDTDGKPQIERVARIVFVYPLDGAGRLRVAVTDWGTPGAGDHDHGAPGWGWADVRHYVSSASGYGYDKRAAALAGCTVGGIELFNHCAGPRGPNGEYIHATLRDVAHREGWTIFGDAG